MRYVLTSCTSFLLLASAIATNAQVTDVGQKVTAALASVGPVPVTTIIQVPRQTTVCDDPQGNTLEKRNGQLTRDRERYVCKKVTVYDATPQTSHQLLQASNIKIVSSAPIIFGTPIRTELTDQLFVEDQLVQSCVAAPPLGQQITLQKAYQRTSAIQIAQSINHTIGGEINSSFKISDSFTVGAKISFGEGTTNGTTTIDTKQETVTRIRTASTTVPAGTAAVLEMKIWPIHFVVPFSTTVTVDADLSRNDRHLQLLSQLLTDPAARTFPITGTIEANDASEGITVEYVVAYDPSRCTGAAKRARVVLEHYRPASDAKFIERANPKN